MRKKLAEETILFISIFKWIVLAAMVGGLVGLSTALFLKLLHWSTGITETFPYYYFLLPVGFVASLLLVRHLSPDAEGHGTEKVIEAIHKNSGKIKPSVVPVKLLATLVTIASGGSAGKEGPCAQIGAGLASLFADIFRFEAYSRKILVICGVSAGFAAVFGTPIAGAIFGVEVLFTGSILYEVLLPSFISGIVSYHVASAMGISYFYHPLKFVPDLNGVFLFKVIIAGIFFGLCSFLLIETQKLFKKIHEKLSISRILQGIAAGAVLICLTLVFSKQYLGLGVHTIQHVIEGGNIVWYAFLLKIIFTAVTLNFGGSGGIVTPIFYIGATSGVVFARIFGLDSSTFAAIGLVALLSGAANTPISASIMSVELFGSTVAPYASIACVISFLMTGHRSVYPSQIFAISKSASLKIELGREIEDAETTLKLRKNSLSYSLLKLASLIKKKTGPHGK